MIRSRDDGGAVYPQSLRAGWSLPLALAADGRFPALRPAPVADTARLILEVVPGERRLLPAFGCRVHLLAAIDSAADRELAAVLVEEALERWAPDLRVERAEVTSVEEGVIGLRLRAWNSWHALSIAHRPAVAGGGRAPWLDVEPEAAAGGERVEDRTP